jgi:predicted enzyme related to lactoylglutathione lyase
MPLDDIARLLQADAPEARRIWVAHRERLRRRAERFRRGVAVIDDALRGQRTPSLENIVELLNEEAETMVETTTCRLIGVTLCVPDIEAAQRFYQRVLGIEFESEQHPGGPRHLHACGGTWKPQEFFLFTLWPREDSGQRTSVEFTVNDVDAAWGRALQAGATSVMKPYDSGEYPRHAAFTDPFGNLVGLYAT